MMNKNEILKIFSENLRAERARKKYTQEVLAEKANITTESLYRIENQKMNPTLVIVSNLALALEISIDTLMPLK